MKFEVTKIGLGFLMLKSVADAVDLRRSHTAGLLVDGHSPGNSSQETTALNAIQNEPLVSNPTATKSTMQCSALGRNGLVLINGRPCKLVGLTRAKTGKHGTAKMYLEGEDLVTGERCEEVCSSQKKLETPILQMVDYTLNAITPDGLLTLKGEWTDSKGLHLPQGELGEEIQTNFESGQGVIVTVLRVCGEECVVAMKIGKELKNVL